MFVTWADMPNRSDEGHAVVAMSRRFVSSHMLKTGTVHRRTRYEVRDGRLLAAKKHTNHTEVWREWG